MKRPLENTIDGRPRSEGADGSEPKHPRKELNDKDIYLRNQDENQYLCWISFDVKSITDIISVLLEEEKSDREALVFSGSYKQHPGTQVPAKEQPTDATKDLRVLIPSFIDKLQIYLRENIYRLKGYKEAIFRFNVEPFPNIEKGLEGMGDKKSIILGKFILNASITDHKLSSNPLGTLLPANSIIGYLVYPFGLVLIAERVLLKNFDKKCLLADEQLKLVVPFLKFVNSLVIYNDRVVPLSIYISQFKLEDLKRLLVLLDEVPLNKLNFSKLPIGSLDGAGKQLSEEVIKESNNLFELFNSVSNRPAAAIMFTSATTARIDPKDVPPVSSPRRDR